MNLRSGSRICVSPKSAESEWVKSGLISLTLPQDPLCDVEQEIGDRRADICSDARSA